MRVDRVYKSIYSFEPGLTARGRAARKEGSESILLVAGIAATTACQTSKLTSSNLVLFRHTLQNLFRMVVPECFRCIFSTVLEENSLSTWMIFEEVCYVVDVTFYYDPS